MRSAGDGELQTTPPSLQWQAPWSTDLGVGGGRVTRKQRLSGTRWLSAPISDIARRDFSDSARTDVCEVGGRSFVASLVSVVEEPDSSRLIPIVSNTI